MSELEIRAKFDEVVESYKDVHTREALESTKKEVNKWRNKLLSVSPSYRKEVEEIKKMVEARRYAEKLSGKLKFMEEPVIEPWMMQSHLRKLNDLAVSRANPQILNPSTLACPECGELDRGNKMNNRSWCMKCNTILTPKGEKEHGPKITRHKHLTEAQKRMRGII